MNCVQVNLRNTGPLSKRLDAGVHMYILILTCERPQCAWRVQPGLYSVFIRLVVVPWHDSVPWTT